MHSNLRNHQTSHSSTHQKSMCLQGITLNLRAGVITQGFGQILANHMKGGGCYYPIENSRKNSRY